MMYEDSFVVGAIVCWAHSSTIVFDPYTIFADAAHAQKAVDLLYRTVEKAEVRITTLFDQTIEHEREQEVTPSDS
jgi:hypothetical protein